MTPTRFKGTRPSRTYYNSAIDKSQETQAKKERKWVMEEGDEYVGHRIINGKRKRIILKRKTKKVHLTREEVEEIKTTFHLFDKDGNEEIDVKELKDAMKALGLNKTKAEI